MPDVTPALDTRHGYYGEPLIGGLNAGPAENLQWLPTYNSKILFQPRV